MDASAMSYSGSRRVIDGERRHARGRATLDVARVLAMPKRRRCRAWRYMRHTRMTCAICASASGCWRAGRARRYRRALRGANRRDTCRAQQYVDDVCARACVYAADVASYAIDMLMLSLRALRAATLMLLRYYAAMPPPMMLRYAIVTPPPTLMPLLMPRRHERYYASATQRWREVHAMLRGDGAGVITLIFIYAMLTIAVLKMRARL